MLTQVLDAPFYIGIRGKLKVACFLYFKKKLDIITPQTTSLCCFILNSLRFKYKTHYWISIPSNCNSSTKNQHFCLSCKTTIVWPLTWRLPCCSRSLRTRPAISLEQPTIFAISCLEIFIWVPSG